MKRIDPATVQRILDATDIVEVVSDFVSLKRRGANYIGLCPFHNERTPSFSVSKSKGVCKCFSCGKGGSAIGFLMEHEQISYTEALRYLARKYNIEIKERELTDSERQAQNERESLMAINEWALKHFENNLKDTDEGVDIGLAYFTERGINRQAVDRFHLGYALDSPDALSKAALNDGFSRKYLIDSGLCSVTERDTLYDRFKGRVIYPIFSVSGKVVAFGGRTLRNDKKTAKYVNSPETALYHKSNELYGLFQAKGAIVRQNKCILVEGYMDVISMAQNGLENVVASSGTSLTEGQIRLIHRFTSNVTVIYDSDPAGIKASLRGIDMLLAEGMDIKVLLLPDGDDPDSFAQAHTTEQILEYIAAHEVDFITFKTDILLQGADKDPIRRASVISDILRSIAVIPDAIKRQVYIQECSRRLAIDEKVLSLELAKVMAGNAERAYTRRQRETADKTLATMPNDEAPADVIAVHTIPASAKDAPASGATTNKAEGENSLDKYEREILWNVIRYGVHRLCDVYDENDTPHPMTVIQYIAEDLAQDNIVFACPLHDRVWKLALDIDKNVWPEARQRGMQQIEDAVAKMRAEGLEAIRTDPTCSDLNKIKAAEGVLETRLKEYSHQAESELQAAFVGRQLANDPDSNIRQLASALMSDKHTISKIHAAQNSDEALSEKLTVFVPRALMELKYRILDMRIDELHRCLSQEGVIADPKLQSEYLRQLQQMKKTSSEFARELGDRVINPSRVARRKSH